MPYAFVAIFWMVIIITYLGMRFSLKYSEGKIIGVPMTEAQSKDTSVQTLLSFTKRKTLWISIAFCLLSALAMLPSLKGWAIVIATFSLFVYLGAIMWSYDLLYRTLWNIVEKRGWAEKDEKIVKVDIRRARERGKGAVSRGWHVASLVISLLPLAFYFTNASYREAIAWPMLIVMPLIVLVFWAVRLTGVRTPGLVPSGDEEKDLLFQRRWEKIVTRTAAVLSVAMSIFWVVTFLIMAQVYDPKVQFGIVIVFVGIVLGIIALEAISIRRTQKDIFGTYEMKRQMPTGQFYKYGMYNNPSDPRVMVPKQFGMGWTLNVGTPKGRIGMIATGVLVGLVLVLVGWMAISGEQGAYTFKADEKQIEISAPMYATTLSRDQIEDIAYLDHMPPANRTNGFGGLRKQFGSYRVEGYGVAQIYIYNDAPVLAIRLRDGWVFVGDEDAEKTKALQDRLEAYRLTGVWKEAN